jgi:hypothetical protein
LLGCLLWGGVTVILTNPGARAQAIPTNMEASVVSIEPKRILTRIEQCAADAAELPTLQASSGIATVVLDMIDLIVTPSTGIGATKTEINERSSPEAVTAYSGPPCFHFTQKWTPPYGSISRRSASCTTKVRVLERHPFPNLCLTAPMSTPPCFCLSQSPSTLRSAPAHLKHARSAHPRHSTCGASLPMPCSTPCAANGRCGARTHRQLLAPLRISWTHSSSTLKSATGRRPWQV